jgi:hypothetical protein
MPRGDRQALTGPGSADLLRRPPRRLRCWGGHRPYTRSSVDHGAREGTGTERSPAAADSRLHGGTERGPEPAGGLVLKPARPTPVRGHHRHDRRLCSHTPLRRGSIDDEIAPSAGPARTASAVSETVAHEPWVGGPRRALGSPSTFAIAVRRRRPRVRPRYAGQDESSSATTWRAAISNATPFGVVARRTFDSVTRPDRGSSTPLWLVRSHQHTVVCHWPDPRRALPHAGCRDRPGPAHNSHRAGPTLRGEIAASVQPLCEHGNAWVRCCSSRGREVGR